MVPVFLLGSAVYLGLSLAQGTLAHEKYLEEARAHVTELEAEVAELRAQATPSSSPDQNLTRKRSWLGW
ncbi:hypothetical protein FIBSPDRAFT_951049 [Athelia psychrophila]|uniref:Dolichol-phosphate mannosyltransferase subunit 3 n=1 Tax=Athelia psychrophila TaxID=1759441 RepID=A0A166N566_9AGAM|nr:hypothetical protein FIBSPDRAFT_951049 [Fibularhizoctonia sp. CBS 109695]